MFLYFIGIFLPWAAWYWTVSG